MLYMFSLSTSETSWFIIIFIKLTFSLQATKTIMSKKSCPSCRKPSIMSAGNIYCGRSTCKHLNTQQKCRACFHRNVKNGNWYCSSCVVAMKRVVCKACLVCFPSHSEHTPVCPKCDRSPVQLVLHDVSRDPRHGTMWKDRL